MQYKKCPKCKATMIFVEGVFRCSQCRYEAKTNEEIGQLETYQKKPIEP